jgi:hypothetical protein
MQHLTASDGVCAPDRIGLMYSGDAHSALAIMCHRVLCPAALLTCAIVLPNMH